MDTHVDTARKVRVYDALFGEPGPASVDTLYEWLRIARHSTREVVEREKRLLAHIGSKTVADQERRISES